MGELIEIKINDNQEPIVSARHLHEILESKERFSKWFEKVLEYGFVESEDYAPYQIVHPQNLQEMTDYSLKLDMAKEAAMVSRLPKGKEVRQHFIQLEKSWNSPEKVMARALLMADKQIKQLNAVIEEQKPKVLFAEAVSSSQKSCLVGEMAKILNQNGVNIGQNRLFEWLRNNGYLCKHGENYNLPTQKAMDLKIMEIKKSAVSSSNGIRATSTAKVTGKGQVYFVDKFLSGKSKLA